MRIDTAAASSSLSRLAAEIGLPAQRVAAGIRALVDETMTGAARVAIAERGEAPPDYALLATGGAGPLHAWEVARRLGVQRILCPPGAGAGSALGMLMAPARVDRAASVNALLDRADWQAVDATFAGLIAEAVAVIRAAGGDMERLRTQRMADLRYVGQGFEVTVALPDALSAAAVQAAFEARYRALFNRTVPGAAVQLVTLRLSLTAPIQGAQCSVTLHRRTRQEEPVKGRRMVGFAEGDIMTDVYDRYALRPGMRFAGPAVIEESESTFVIGPGGRAQVLADGAILVELPA